MLNTSIFFCGLTKNCIDTIGSNLNFILNFKNLSNFEHQIDKNILPQEKFFFFVCTIDPYSSQHHKLLSMLNHFSLRTAL